MSGDSEQEYFSDGITEDIITELSRFPILFVIARHSSFAFKGKSIDIKEVGQRLGVEYMVEGSVRKAGNRVRISAQLIEVETGNHIWAERYDRELEDIFAVQDEVTRAVVAVLPGRVEKAVAERVQRKPTDNMKAYEFVLRGKMHGNRLNAEDVAEARRLSCAPRPACDGTARGSAASDAGSLPVHERQPPECRDLIAGFAGQNLTRAEPAIRSKRSTHPELRGFRCDKEEPAHRIRSAGVTRWKALASRNSMMEPGRSCAPAPCRPKSLQVASDQRLRPVSV